MRKSKLSTTVKPHREKRMPYSLAQFKRDKWAWILLLPALSCIYLFIIRTQVQGVYWSFFDMKGFTPTKFIGLDNYIRVVKDTAFLKTVGNTFKYVIYSVLIGFPLPFLVAVVMNEIIHFRKITRVMVYLPSVLPAMATAMLWYFIYFPDESGLLNSILVKFGMEPYGWLQDGNTTILWIVLFMTWSGMGATALYYFAALQGINRELYEAAIIDGAGFFKRIKIVTLPYMYGMLILFLIKQIIGVFNVMEVVLQMTDGGPNNASITLGVLNYKYGFVLNKPGFAMALGVMMFIFLSIFAVIYFKLNKKIEENQM